MDSFKLKTKQHALTLLAIFVIPVSTHATIIDLGQINLTGNFTLNHNFNFNSPTMPFGTFGTLTVQSATGVFSPYVLSGDTLSMNTDLMYVSSGSTPVLLPDGSVVFGSLPSPMLWSIDGFSINTLWTNVAGSDSGRSCLGLISLTGNGFDPLAYPFYPGTTWNFTAPPYDITNFPADITGPINMTIDVAFDVVPDQADTAVLLLLALSALLFTHRLVKA